MLRARNSTVFVLLALGCLPAAGVAGPVTEIIYGRNTLDDPRSIAVDNSGNAYVTGYFSNNAFKPGFPTWSVRDGMIRAV